jgi:tRNA(adenine34) deaminase
VIWQQRDKDLMRRALELASEAEAAGEVPVGAVLARGDELLGEGGNRVIRDSDPSAHAEIIALRQAGRAAGNYRLAGTTMYVTLEPCAMCAGALVHARVERVVFAAHDPQVGAGGSLFNLLDSPHLKHRCIVSAGLMAESAEELMDTFFGLRRS